MRSMTIGLSRTNGGKAWGSNSAERTHCLNDIKSPDRVISENIGVPGGDWRRINAETGRIVGRSLGLSNEPTRLPHQGLQLPASVDGFAESEEMRTPVPTQSATQSDQKRPPCR
jgi:hypothetical protein